MLIAQADPDQMAHEEDERERRALFLRARDLGELTIAQLAILLGQSGRFVGRYGVIGARLIDEARAGRLRTAQPLNRVPCGDVDDWTKRHNPATAPVSREAARAWIFEHGDAHERASLAAQWAMP